MAEIYNLFSTDEPNPKTFSVESANRTLPLVRRFTEEAIEETDELSVQLQYLTKESPQFRLLAKRYDEALMRWAERIHRIGGIAKGLWLVDFDTGQGYLCWSHPEERVDHFHAYDGSYKTRVKVI